MATLSENRKYLKLWDEYKRNTKRATPIDLNETAAQKQSRIKRLEANFESWCKYYFPNHYTSEPANFHVKSSKKVITTPEYSLVRSWSRELAKTSRTRMEVLFLTLTGKKRNVLLVSNSQDNAERLILPYKVQLESNQRIINDYGAQENLGQWEAGEFVTKKGTSFRALGAGQSPRGTNNDAVRPDVILLDDIDTDEECRNPERIKEKVKWIFEALFPTRSINKPILKIACGNIIAKYCCITELAKKADRHEIINIRDENGKSTWEAKNTEELIDIALRDLPFSAIQKEYYNNPISEGTTFKDVNYGKVQPLKRCDRVVIYADPATSNKDRAKTKNKQSSHKAVGVISSYRNKRFLDKVWLDIVNNSTFVDWLFQAYLYCKEQGVDTVEFFIENNSLQDPFYQQVLKPLIYEKSKEYGVMIPIREDKRNKPDKFFRIEGTLQPIHSHGNLIFNEREKADKNMERMHDQMISVSEKCPVMDGPDMLEGGVWIIENKSISSELEYAHGARPNRHY